MISLRNFALRRGERLLLSDVDLTMHAGYRVGVVGRNGTGKSSLFAAIRNEIEADKGDIELSGRVRIASVAQETPSLPDPAIEFVLSGDVDVAGALRAEAKALAAEDWEAVAMAHHRLEEVNGYDASARAGKLLHGLGFPADTHQRAVSSFSGGWRVRLNLARALMTPSDLLLLDEPTNHLDLATREALSMALNEFEGTVMLVSHDRALLRAVCDEFWMVGRGAVGPFDGDLDDYQRYLLDEAKRQRELAKLEAAAESAALKAAAPAPAVAVAKAVAIAPVSIAASADQISARGQNDAKPAVDAKEQRKQDAQARQQLAEKTRPLKRELEQIDQRLSALVAERADLEQRLTQPLPPAEIADLGRRLKAGHDETAQLEERWLEISAGLEELGVGTSA